jgi:hypothetical protein
VLHRTRSVAAALLSAGILAFGVLPASAATPDGTKFSIPGVHGISAWGSYQHVPAGVRVTVCVQVTSRDVYGGAAAAAATEGVHRQAIAAVTVGYGHSKCQTMVTRYTEHLAVDALSGYRDGKIRQVGHIHQIY